MEGVFLVIGFVHHYGLGDNVKAISGFFVLKKIYECKLIVFGNALMSNLCRYLSFVDECIDIGKEITSHHIDLVNSYHCDYIILSNPKRKFLHVLSRTNCRTIITTTKIATLFSKRYKTIPLLYLPKYRKQDGIQNLCALIRKINPRLYDSKITDVDFSQSCIRTATIHKEVITDFFKKSLKHEITAGGKESYKQFYIMVNPFCWTASHTIQLDDWLNLIKKLIANPQYVIVVVTYDSVHDDFMQKLSQDSMLYERCLIYRNGNDILYLVEIIARMSCVISPSTGPIHIASNLFIPTIGLYSQYDTIKWATWDKNYVIIPKPTNKLSSKEIDTILIKTMQLLDDGVKTAHIIPKTFNALCRDSAFHT